MCSLCGFGTAPSFTSLSEDDIQKAYDFVRNKLAKRLDWSSEQNKELMVHFYGKFYSSSPIEFEFQPGELKLIDTLVQHVKSILDTQKDHPYKYFRKKKSVRVGQHLIDTPFGQFFGNQQEQQQQQQTQPKTKSISTENAASSKNLLINDSPKNDFETNDSDISDLLESLQKKFVKELERFGYDIDVISRFKCEVSIDDHGKICGAVCCVLCCDEEKTQPKFAIYWNKSYWVVTNYFKHLIRCHDPPKPPSSIPKKGQKKSAKSRTKVTSTPKQKNIKSKRLPEKSARETISTNPIVVKHENELVELSDENSLQTIKIDSIEPVIEESLPDDYNNDFWETLDEEHLLENEYSENDDATKEIEHSADCSTHEIHLSEQEERIYTQISDQESKMRACILKNNESETFIDLFHNNKFIGKIETCDVPADGNCMLSAMAHQLFQEKIGSKQHVQLTEQIRSNAVKYIRENIADFDKILEDRIDEKKTRKTRKTNTKRANDAFLKRLAKSGEWGSTEMLLAVSRIYKTNIILFNENGSCYLVDGFKFDYAQCILLAYTFYNGSEKLDHYQSVCKINQNIIFTVMGILINVIKNKSNFDVVEC